MIEHPNIVSIYDAGTDDDGFYMVLEWLPDNLEQWITKNGKMSWPDFYSRIGRPVLDALSFSQGHNWSHRDIKPTNILLTDKGVVKIADYGIAKHLEQPALGLTFNRFRSAPFTPPEDDDREEWRRSRDYFSVAALAVYCLTGKLPSDYGELATLASGLDGETTPAALIQSALSHTPPAGGNCPRPPAPGPSRALRGTATSADRRTSSCRRCNRSCLIDSGAARNRDKHRCRVIAESEQDRQQRR